MKKCRIWVTDDVSRSAELPMWEGLNWTGICSGARIVRKDDLGGENSQ